MKTILILYYNALCENKIFILQRKLAELKYTQYFNYFNRDWQ